MSTRASTVSERKGQMRSYLYLWNKPTKHRFVASGLELEDLLPALAGRGIYLLRHQWDGDSYQGFDSVHSCETLLASALDSFGSRAWRGFYDCRA
jgi:hypothetical protein